jgi:hypothetical protein
MTDSHPTDGFSKRFERAARLKYSITSAKSAWTIELPA